MILVGAVLVVLWFANKMNAAQAAVRFTAPQSDYILHCGGCHGPGGVSNSRLVPNLKDLAGYYLDIPEGRDYLARLPNVAFSSLNDQRLAAVLNYVVTEIGGGTAPARAKPYTAAEVGKLRKQPLTEVTLSKYRRQLVEALIDEHHAPAALRIYGAGS
jgi:mono/diheme cytochrome c family protein